MRIAVLGAGSLGTITGALLAKAGEDVTLIDSYKDHVDALNKNGATIVGKMDEVIPVKASISDDLDGTFDLVLFQTKHNGINSALDGILPHTHDDTVFLTLQNGIPEDTVAARVGESRVIGGSVGWGATFKGPGISELTSDRNGMDIIIGELDGTISDRILKIEKILSSVCNIIVSDNLVGTKWSKLAANCTSSGMSTVLGATFGEVSDNFDSFTCEAYISVEAAKVMKAAGIKPIEIHEFLVDEDVISFNTMSDLKKLHPYYKNRIRLHQGLIASMLQDIQHGRKTEINEINGKIVEYGVKYGIQTPFNKKVVEIVTKIQDGELKPSWSNLKLFNFPTLAE